MSINKNGFWEGIEAASQHQYDSNLASALTKFFKQENAISIADFGCGMGNYVKTFNYNNIKASGFDGNPNTPQLTQQNCCTVLDLSIPILFDSKFDWILSLEVGEHIPQQFEHQFINNLHNNNKRGIILSWAVEGQGGQGHFNERNNTYIKHIFSNLGYFNDIIAENILRRNSTLTWFKNTIMVFRKN